MSRPRVAYVVNAGLPNGKAHGLQIASMSDALSALGCDVTIYSPRRRASEGSSFAAFHGLRRRVQHTALPNTDVVRLEGLVPGPVYRALYLTHALGWGLYATSRIARGDHDLFVTRDAPTAFWFSRLGYPTVFEVHTMPRGPQRRLLRAVARSRGLRAALALTSCTRAELVEDGFDPTMVHVLPDGVDLEKFVTTEDRAVVRARIGVPDGRPVVGYVGSLRAVGYDKGVSMLVDAVAELRRRDAERAPLLVVVGGSVEESSACATHAAALGLGAGDVIFRSRVDHADVPAWMRACDILAIPSPGAGHLTYHSSPLKLFEYMASGAAIVASDLPSLRDVLAHERNAILFESGSREALADAIDRLVREPSLRARCQARAAADAVGYSWVERARRMLAVGVVRTVDDRLAGLAAMGAS